MRFFLKDIDYKKYIPIVLTALLLFSSICLTSGNTVIIYMCIAIVSFGYVIYMLITEKKALLDVYDVWLVLIFLLLMVNSMISPYKGGFSVKYFLLMCVCIICIYYFMKNDRTRIYDFVGCVVECTSVISIIYIAIHELPTFVMNYSEITKGYMRYRFGLISGINASTIAYFFGILAIVTFYLVFIEKKLRLIYVYVLQIIVTFLSGSKKGLILIVIPMIFYFFRIGLKSIRNFVIFAVILLIIGIAVFKIPLLYNVMGYRILDALNELGIVPDAVLPESAIIDESTTKRVEMMGDAWRMFTQKPILGWGWNAFASLAGYGYYCHNNYLEILVSMGIVGFVMYYSMPIILIVGSIKQKNKNKRFLCISLIFSILFLDISSVTIYGQVIAYFMYAFLFLLEDIELPYIKILNKRITVVNKKDVKIKNAE